MKQSTSQFDAQIVDSIAHLRYWLIRRDVDRSIFELLEKIESDYPKSIVAAPIPNATAGEWVETSGGKEITWQEGA